MVVRYGDGAGLNFRATSRHCDSLPLEAAAALSTRYQEQRRGGSAGSEDELRQPISASEVDEASNMVFQRSPAVPSDYVFSPSATVPSEQGGGNVYPRLRPNQTLRGEVLAMGHRLAAHPAVQNAIVDDLVHHGHRVPSGRRGINPSLQSPPGDERGLARLVDMLEPEEEATHRSRSNRRSSGRDSGLLLVRDRRGFFDYDNEEPLEHHLHLDPRVSQEWQGVYAAAARDEDWQPWAEEEKKEEAESELGSSRLSDGKLGCSCRKCHESKDEVGVEEEASEGNCWKDVLAEYECDICFEVLVGVHVLDNCGHHFCGGCMERWMDNAPQGECPVCRTLVDKLVPVRKMDEMILKAVDAAAPSRERSAWYERRAHWEGTARRRQETADRARAATAAASAVHAHAAAVSRHAVPRRQATAEAGGGGEEGEGGGGAGDGFRLNKMQAVLAVAVMLVMAVMKLRGFKR